MSRRPAVIIRAAKSVISIPEYAKIFLYPWTISKSSFNDLFIKMCRPISNDPRVKIEPIVYKNLIFLKGPYTSNLLQHVRQTIFNAGAFQYPFCPYFQIHP